MKIIFAITFAIATAFCSANGFAQTTPVKQDSMKVQYRKVASTNFFDAENFNTLIKRLDNIQPNAKKQWGQMNVAQMLHHLNLAIGSGIGYYQLEDKSTFRSRGIDQFIVLNVLKRFPMETATPTTLKVTETYNFNIEKTLLKEILEKAFVTKNNKEWSSHTYFGKMSRKNWGKLIMIHCNHHFQQYSN